MSKYCKNCGKELVDEAKFCPACGTHVVDAVKPSGSSPTTYSGNRKIINEETKTNPIKDLSENKKNGKLLAIGCAAVVLILICIIVSSMNAYKKPLQYLEKGFNKSSAKTFMKAFPDGYFHRYDFMDEEKVLEKLNEELKEYDLKVNIKVLGKEKIDKDELESYEYNDVTPTKGYRVELRVASSEGGVKNDPNTCTIPVLKMDGKWVVTTSSIV